MWEADEARITVTDVEKCDQELATTGRKQPGPNEPDTDDGGPTDGDAWRTAAQRVKTEVSAKGLEFFAVGVSGADMQVLSEITPRALVLDGLKFRELFVWLSQSQRRVSGSKVGEQVPMPKVSFGSPIS